MDKKKQESRILEQSKSSTRAIARAGTLKKSFLSIKNLKAKTTLKKVGRSRTQKGHKNY